MKLEAGDDVDESLIKVLVHEFSRCELAFNLFISLIEKNIYKLYNYPLG